MWSWIRRSSTPPATPAVSAGLAGPVMAAGPDPPPPARERLKAGPYRLLHDYLRQRYADSVVLTFSQIEDLIGFSLPSEARSDQGWWHRGTAVATDAHCSDAWVLAKRTARPNLRAQTVIFDRIA